MDVYRPPSATDFVKVARSLLLARIEDAEPGRIAAREYPRLLTKAAVDGIGFSTSSGEDLTGARAIARDFARAVEPLTILGKLSGVVPVPFDTPLPFVSARSAAKFLAEFEPVPVVKPTLVNATFKPKKISAITVVSKELLRNARSAEATLRRELTASVVTGLDSALLDPAHTLSDGRPASLTSEADLIFDGSGATDPANIDSLLSAMLGHMVALGSQMQTLAWITSRENAVGLALLRTAVGGTQAYPTVSAQGGVLAGLPLLVSDGCPRDALVLADAAALMLADENDATLAVTDSALIDMDDAPGGSNRVSMFTTDSLGLRITRYLNWSLAVPHVVYAKNFELAIATVSTTE